MELNVVSFIVGILGLVGGYLITRPQEKENKALHDSIDANTAVLKELSDLITEIRIQQANLQNHVETLQRDQDDMRDRCRTCQNYHPVKHEVS